MSNSIFIEEKKYNKKIVKFMNIWLMFLLYSLAIGYLFSRYENIDTFKSMVIGGMVGLSFPLYIPVFVLKYLL
jgi:hypothetical protein